MAPVDAGAFFCWDERDRSLAPVVFRTLLIGEDGVEGFGLLDEDVGFLGGLVEKHGLEADEFEHGEEHADESALGVGVVEQAARAYRFIFHH